MGIDEKVILDTTEIRNKLEPIFINAPIYRAILFGSYAKGMATELSDIDIVIDSRGELLNIYFYGVLEDMIQVLRKNVDLLEMSEIKPNSLIDQEIKQQGVLLYERQGQNYLTKNYQLC